MKITIRLEPHFEIHPELCFLKFDPENLPSPIEVSIDFGMLDMNVSIVGPKGAILRHTLDIPAEYAPFGREGVQSAMDPPDFNVSSRRNTLTIADAHTLHLETVADAMWSDVVIHHEGFFTGAPQELTSEYAEVNF